MSRIRADKFVNSGATGAPQLTFGAEVVAGVGLTGAGGINITGIATAASFSGNATGLTGTPDIAVRNITGVAATFTGSVSIGGTLTYEDVTNIDSVGIITARSDVSIADKIIHTGDTNTAIRFPAADTFTVETGGSERLRTDSSGNVLVGKTSSTGLTAGCELRPAGLGVFTRDSSNPLQVRRLTDDGNLIEIYQDTSLISSIGVQGSSLTVGTGSGSAERFRITSAGTAIFKGGLAEKVNVKTQLTSANACAITDGNIILTTGNEPGNTYPNITGVHSVLSSGEGFSVTVALKVNGSGTINGFQIDGVAQTIEWSGGSAPSAGSSGYDVFTFSAFKTGSGTTDYTVFGAASNYA